MKEGNERVRCWICGRSENRIRKDLEELDCEYNLVEAVKHRAEYDVDNERGEGEEGSLIHWGSGEFLGVESIPLCVVCQSLLLYQASVMAHVAIDNEVAEGDLMGAPSEYAIVPKAQVEEAEAGWNVTFLNLDKDEKNRTKEMLKGEIEKYMGERPWLRSHIRIEEDE